MYLTMKIILSLIIAVISFSGCSSEQKINEENSKLPDLGGEEIVSPSFYQEKFLRGIDFYARGNEPNWVLEIDFDSLIRFSEMNGIEFVTPTAGIKLLSESIMDISARTERGEILITISNKTCQDNMSGEMFDYAVLVKIKRNNDSDFFEFTGCGKYLYDYRLHDIWVMEEMTNVELKKENLMKGLPMFEFNLREMRFGGHAGCNEISGTIELKGDKITFGNLISTKMACPDMTVEQKVLSVLSEKSFSYKIEKLKLTLQSGDGIKMIFRKID